MKRYLIIFLSLISFYLNAQELKELKPNEIMPLDLSEEKAKAFDKAQEACNKIWEKISEGTEQKELSKEEQATLLNCSEEKESFWQIIGSGCSWYCGGGPDEVKASSELKAQGENTYAAANAHDLDYKTAWVEGAEGDGIGEYLLYHFGAHSPRITNIQIVNGYVKSEKAWRNNSRVKKLKLYFNDKPMAILHLSDERAEQGFEFEPIGRNNGVDWKDDEKPKDWTLKFEILEVYKGDKYDDVVISEIYFEGVDVHCLAKGTNITMADYSQKPIEDLKIGDQVLSLNHTTGKFEASKIIELASPMHCDLVELTFTNGTTMTCTKDHPLLATNKQWLSLDPIKTRSDYEFEQVDLLTKGSQIKSNKDNLVLEIASIQAIHQMQETYTIVNLEQNNTFIANGVVVGTEELRIMEY